MLRRVTFVVMALAVIALDYAIWLGVTGGGGAWRIALIAVAVMAATVVVGNRLVADDVSGCVAVGAIVLSSPVALALPLLHVGHYAGHGGWTALVVVGTLGLLLVVAMLVVSSTQDLFGSFWSPWK